MGKEVEENEEGSLLSFLQGKGQFLKRERGQLYQMIPGVH